MQVQIREMRLHERPLAVEFAKACGVRPLPAAKQLVHNLSLLAWVESDIAAAVLARCDRSPFTRPCFTLVLPADTPADSSIPPLLFDKLLVKLRPSALRRLRIVGPAAFETESLLASLHWPHHDDPAVAEPSLAPRQNALSS